MKSTLMILLVAIATWLILGILLGLLPAKLLGNFYGSPLYRGLTRFTVRKDGKDKASEKKPSKKTSSGKKKSGKAAKK